MRDKLKLFILLSLIHFLFMECTKDNHTDGVSVKSYIDTLTVPHSAKGWELYSWSNGNEWNYSILIGTNRIKTFEEVTLSNSTGVHLITVTGIDSLELVLTRFPEGEFITWIGEGWLESSWGVNYGNLKLPPQKLIDEITVFCKQKKLILQVTG